MTNECIDFLNSNYPKEKFEGDLSRIRRALELFNIVQSDFKKIVTIAGTNGKGTVSRGLYQAILEENKKSALWTSPHLFSITERFSFQGVDISEPELLETFKATHYRLLQNNLSLSFYEFNFLCFLIVSKRKETEILILEVGLGGRLDATNILDCDIAIITSISRDHTEILGNSYKKILTEKLGIVKKDSTLIAGAKLKYIHQLLTSFAKKHEGETFLRAEFSSISELNSWYIETAMRKLGFKTMGQAIDRAPSRKGKFSYSCCHNIDAVRNLVSSYKDLESAKASILLISYSHRDYKELTYMSKLFLKLKDLNIVEELYLTSCEQFKSASKEDLKKVSSDLGIIFVEEEELEGLIDKHESIYLSGSNYFVGEFINRFS